MAGYFITGTDTGVGKTGVALALMRIFKAQGRKVSCMKPVSAGCDRTNDGLRNDDALKLINESSFELPYEIVNPYAYEPPIAPHIAAQMIGERIDVNVINIAFEKILKLSDLVIAEGAGGWLVPINDRQTMADVAEALQLPVILVVGLRLGCLNHALLSVAAINNSGLPLAGWIANHLTEHMEESQANIVSLQSRIDAPLLGVIPYITSDLPERVESYIDIGKLKN